MSTTQQPTSASRRQFIKYGVAGAIGFGVASAIEIPILNNSLSNDNSTINKKNTQINQLQSQNSSLQSQLSTAQGQLAQSQAFLALGVNEQKEVEAMVETIIPTDSNGAGAKEAGVIYFIDRQLATDYGNNARMYTKGPFIMPGQAGPLTVNNVTYSEGSPPQPFTGPAYQYSLTLREFWRLGLQDLEAYSNSAYGSNFENLTVAQQTQVLTDFYNNKPTNTNVIPLDFFNEVIFMTWSGFLMDPAYGGNMNMVGWTFTGFTGANEGDTFNEGRNVMQLMVASTPTRFPPHSLGQLQQAIGGM
jgi:gluconate 2-dehydrogenase gamma chain